MNRPSTSKPRGICRFYTTRGGCREGDKCKFLHGQDETHTPYDKSKTCNFFLAGYCTRGSSCWFRHSLPAPAVAGPSAQTPPDSDAESCSVCYEKPTTYGLLVGCSHVFCVKCIRDWRDRTGKGEEVVLSGNIKKCPMCRQSSRFIIPSSIFYAEGSPEKKRTLEKYKASMARVPCRHFEKSGRTFCPFGRDCFYQHLKFDGTPQQLSYGVDDNPRRSAPLPRRNFMDDIDLTLGLHLNPEMFLRLPEPSQPIEPLFDDPLQDLRATIEHIRASIPDPTNGEVNWSGEPVAELEAPRMATGEMQALTNRLLATLHRFSGMQIAALRGVFANGTDDPTPEAAVRSDGEDELPPLADVSSDDNDDDEPPSLEPIPSLTINERSLRLASPVSTHAEAGTLFASDRTGVAGVLAGPDPDGDAIRIHDRASITPSRFSAVVPGRAAPSTQMSEGELERAILARDIFAPVGQDAAPADDSMLTLYDDALLRASAQAVVDADVLGERAAAVLRDVAEGELGPSPRLRGHDDEHASAQEAPPMPATSRGFSSPAAPAEHHPGADALRAPTDADESADDVWEAQQNSNPPFKTDGRGKVVFASAVPENGEIEGGVVEARRRRHTRG